MAQPRFIAGPVPEQQAELANPPAKAGTDETFAVYPRLRAAPTQDRATARAAQAARTGSANGSSGSQT